LLDLYQDTITLNCILFNSYSCKHNIDGGSSYWNDSLGFCTANVLKINEIATLQTKITMLPIFNHLTYSRVSITRYDLEASVPRLVRLPSFTGDAQFSGPNWSGFYVRIMHRGKDGTVVSYGWLLFVFLFLLFLLMMFFCLWTFVCHAGQEATRER
jgi:hypothetical protein